MLFWLISLYLLLGVGVFFYIMWFYKAMFISIKHFFWELLQVVVTWPYVLYKHYEHNKK